MKWKKVSQTQKENFCEMTKLILAQIPPPFEAQECKDFTCTDPSHLQDLDSYYSNLVTALLYASSDLVQVSTNNLYRKPNVPGWNSTVRNVHCLARNAYISWKYKEKPQLGDLHQIMVDARKHFKYTLRHCRNNYEKNKAEGLTQALQTDRSKKSFRKKIKSSKTQQSLPTTVGGVTGPELIAGMWKKHFSQILNCSQCDKVHDVFVDQHIKCEANYEHSDDLLSNPNIIESLLYKLPLNSASIWS